MITGRKIYRLNDAREWQIAENAGNEIVARLATQYPLAEKYASTSPYVYCVGNPVRLVDLDGRGWVEGPTGNIYWNNKIDQYNYGI